VSGALAGVGTALYGAAWELRRRAYALGLLRPHRVPARVVSVGNLTVGGTGKTTLILHLARLQRQRGGNVGVVCRRYRPGPGGEGDEERLLRNALGGACVFAGVNKRQLAARAAAAGYTTVLVDDGFSHWALARDVDIVLLDAQDLWGGGRLLPAGRMREPRRSLQRAHALVISRLGPDDDAAPFMATARRYGPAALLAAGRHRVVGVRALDGTPAGHLRRAWIVTGTGNPDAVAKTVQETGCEVVGLSRYRDHHWFGRAEWRRELAQAQAASATVVLTSKDAVRLPRDANGIAVAAPARLAAQVAVLEVEWEWVSGGDAVERLALGEP
jgi:tetraacyldisaccharide 4'-kinase